MADDVTRAELSAQIKAKRAQQERLPIHFKDAREVIAVELERLIDQYLALAE